MRQRIPVKRSNAAPEPARTQTRTQNPANNIQAATTNMKGRLLSTLRTVLPGAWIVPRDNELITLYRLRYKMAMEDEKYDIAMIFLNKILELDPMNLEAKLCKGDIYHRCLHDYPKAIEHYNKVIRLSTQDDTVHTRARAAMSEIMEMLS